MCTCACVCVCVCEITGIGINVWRGMLGGGKGGGVVWVNQKTEKGDRRRNPLLTRRIQ